MLTWRDAGVAIIRFKLEDNNILIEECEDEKLCSSLKEHGYIVGDYIDPLEAFYLLSKGKAELNGSTGWRTALLLALTLGLDVDLAFVYIDLRRRGRKPRLGVRKRTLVYAWKGGRFEVLVLSEGYPVRLGDIVEWSRIASGDGYTPVVAVVDRHGTVTYYEARTVTSLS